MTVGLLTSPLPFLLLGAVLGAMLMLAICLAASEFVRNRRRHEDLARVTAERRYELALRDVLGACDCGGDLRRIRRVARRALHPQAVAIDDEPILPEVSHG